MKKLNQKQWGILGTSLGSVLIIVALLTMVGIGSGDTYATQTTFCTCEKGERTGNTCTVTESVTCVAGSNVSSSGISTSCSSLSSDYKCTGAGACVDRNANYIAGCTKNTCTRTIKETCTCTSGTPNSTGECVDTGPTPTSTTCAGGTYYDGNTGCLPCTAGFYCPSGTYSHAKGDINGSGRKTCPAGSYCPAGVSGPKTCDPGYTTNGTGKTSKADCVQSSGSDSACTNKNKGETCTTSDGKDGTCIDSGSSSGGRVCKANSPGSDTNYVHCDKGWFYTGDGKTCTKCPSGSWCPGGNFLASSLVRDGGVKCPDDRPYSEPGSYQESDCKASGSGGGNPSNPSSSGGSSGGNPSNPSSGGSSGNDGNGGNGGAGNGNASGNGSNTNTNPSTATKTPLVIVIIGMVAMGLGTFTYYKSKNNEI